MQQLWKYCYENISIPVDTRHQDSKYEILFWDVGNLRRSGGIVAYFSNEKIRNDLSKRKRIKSKIVAIMEIFIIKKQ